MGHPLRWFIPGLLYEVTTRTIQERFLIRPGDACRDVILGILGRGLALYPTVRLHAFVYMSNHSHLLMSADDGDEFVQFMGYVNGNVAREVGRLHGWRGPFWGQRGRPIPVLDDEAAIARLRYILAQGVKEGLVASPRDWPGASSTPALLGCETLAGTWVHRDLEARAKRRANPPPPNTYAASYEVPLSPIPPWARLPEGERHARHRALVEDIEFEHRSSRPAGAASVRNADPQDRPAAPARSPAPRCHASTSSLRRAFAVAYREFVAAFRSGVQRVHDVMADTWTSLFPPGSFPRPRAYVPNRHDATLNFFSPFGSKE